ncbi:hypothetical protein Golomagni_08205 [Golovinomyces magnicellulatus]|nr:hypothetical protein Golomagni_08205 [Golovinomyces magnicellulatus]
MSKPDKSFVISTTTIKDTQFSYAHLTLSTNGPDSIVLDDLQVKSYCNGALQQFLGLTGLAIPVDILKVTETDCWLRVPRQDLSNFAAAITAWRGKTEGTTQYLLRIKQCSDWLGTLVGPDESNLWE